MSRKQGLLYRLGPKEQGKTPITLRWRAAGLRDLSINRSLPSQNPEPAQLLPQTARHLG